jgi:tetratricopeptide (TPR) repeat protein
MVLKAVQDYQADTRKQFWYFAVPVLLYLAVLNLFLSPAYKNPLAYAEQAIISNPHSALAYFIRGNEIYKTGKVDSALNDFSQAVAIHPQYVEARLNRALILIQRQQFEEALPDLDFLISNKPGSNAPAYNARGIVKANLKDNESAFKDFAMAVKLNPALEEATRNLAISRRSLAAEYNTQGIALAQKGDYKKAFTLFTIAIATDETFYQAIVNLGNCCQVMGDLKGACEAWQKAAGFGDKTSAGKLNKYCR